MLLLQGRKWFGGHERIHPASAKSVQAKDERIQGEASPKTPLCTTKLKIFSFLQEKPSKGSSDSEDRPFRDISPSEARAASAPTPSCGILKTVSPKGVKQLSSYQTGNLSGRFPPFLNL